MPRACRVLINFVDGSFMYAELSKKIESNDTMLICHKVLGLPEGTPADKPTIAGAVMRTAKAGECLEMAIPVARVGAVSVQEEYLGKDVPNDMKELWK
jgi:hypothetical protein